MICSVFCFSFLFVVWMVGGRMFEGGRERGRQCNTEGVHSRLFWDRQNRFLRLIKVVRRIGGSWIPGIRAIGDLCSLGEGHKCSGHSGSLTYGRNFLPDMVWSTWNNFFLVTKGNKEPHVIDWRNSWGAVAQPEHANTAVYGNEKGGYEAVAKHRAGQDARVIKKIENKHHIFKLPFFSPDFGAKAARIPVNYLQRPREWRDCRCDLRLLDQRNFYRPLHHWTHINLKFVSSVRFTSFIAHFPNPIAMPSRSHVSLSERLDFLNIRYTTLLLVLGLVDVLGPFATDANLPAFPEMAEHFKCSPAFVQSTVLIYALVMAISQLLGGYLSDSQGRRFNTLR